MSNTGGSSNWYSGPWWLNPSLLRFKMYKRFKTYKFVKKGNNRWKYKVDAITIVYRKFIVCKYL